MEGLKTRSCRLLMLALGLGVVGCADLRGRGDSSARRASAPSASAPSASAPSMASPKTTDAKDLAALPPPRPAPALFIPGTTAVAAKEPGKLPQLQANTQAPPTTAGFKTELTPLPPLTYDDERKPPADAKTTHDEPATLPALVARTQENAPADTARQAAVSPLRDLAQKALDRVGQMDNYVMRMRRREMLNGVARPEELVLCKFRREPFSVYMKWLGSEAKGREVIYVQGRHDSKLHTLTAAGDVPLLPAGKHMTFAVDSVLVKNNSRYPITNAGMANLVQRFADLVAASEKADFRFGTVKYLGLIKRPEFDQEMPAVVHLIPPRTDPLFPTGGKRLFFFDAALNLPVLVIAFDENEREQEYYCHDRFMIPGRLDDADFDPAQWSKPASRK